MCMGPLLYLPWVLFIIIYYSAWSLWWCEEPINRCQEALQAHSLLTCASILLFQPKPPPASKPGAWLKDTPQALAAQHKGRAKSSKGHTEDARGFPDHTNPACRKHWGLRGSVNTLETASLHAPSPLAHKVWGHPRAGVVYSTAEIIPSWVLGWRSRQV